MKEKISILLVLMFGSLLLTTCTEQSEQAAGQTTPSLVELVKQGKSEIFTVPFYRYETNTKPLPIGVFDSGIGGLTVLAAILELDVFNNLTHEPVPDGRPDFENERFVYLGDQANMPYGNYPSEQKVGFLRELIIKDVVFLLGSRYWPSADSPKPHHDKPPVKAIVIACNTATAYGLETVRDALKQWDLTVHLVGVVEAGADGAIQTINEPGKRGTVAVLATVGTCKSQGYVRAIKKSASQAGIEPPAVIQQGCLGLAGAIEGDPSYITSPEAAAAADYHGPAVDNKEAPIEPSLFAQYNFETNGFLGNLDSPLTWRLNSVENYIRYHTTSLVERYRQRGGSEPISTVILGCTHFPYQMERIANSFGRLRNFRKSDGSEPYKNLILEQLSFIDPAALTATQLYEALADAKLLIDKTDESILTTDEFYISVPNASLTGPRLAANGGFTYEYKYGRFPGNFAVEYVKRVPMSSANLSDTVRHSIKTAMPEVWKRLVTFSHKSPRTKDLPNSARMQ
ncbi:MAG: aspartate/glutamate racemase family protein [Phycisphaerae bacterium]|nr:aspartate/glutamate racemase family protein [Phycisphaerae bacterium]